LAKIRRKIMNKQEMGYFDNYDKYNKKQLLKLVAETEIAVKNTATKKQLIQILRYQDLQDMRLKNFHKLLNS